MYGNAPPNAPRRAATPETRGAVKHRAGDLMGTADRFAGRDMENVASSAHRCSPALDARMARLSRPHDAEAQRSFSASTAAWLCSRSRVAVSSSSGFSRASSRSCANAAARSGSFSSAL